MPRSTRRSSSHRHVVHKAPSRDRLYAIAGAALAVRPRISPAELKAGRPTLFAAAMILALVALLIAFFNTDQFYVYNVETVGTKYLTPSEVEKASGAIGYSVFFIDNQQVERAVSRLPEVKSVRVSAGFPNSLVIDVQERQPQILWLRGSETFWVDDNGIAFPARAKLSDLITIRDLDQTPIRLGQTVPSNVIAALNALRLAWKDAPRSWEWSNGRGLAFTDEHGWKVYLGDATEMPGKLVKFRAIASQLGAQNARVKFIDLGKGDPYYQ